MTQTPSPPGGPTATTGPIGPNGTSTRPYLVRALHEWCTDNGFTPYIAVFVDANVRVPMEYVKNNEIVLNVGFEATTALKLGNDMIEFKARFGGIGRDISVPVDHVIAIYARENGQGMAFPVPTDAPAGMTPAAVDTGRGPNVLHLANEDDQARGQTGMAGTPPEPPPPPPDAPPAGGRPSLKRVK